MIFVNKLYIIYCLLIYLLLVNLYDLFVNLKEIITQFYKISFILLRNNAKSK